ncbi:MAG: SGNH/GDSL hydrolase family protein [Acidobacteriia bacterium]|nr:SGNH/GDSL hydrolase family protein [Terriglobia bacterium]
MSLIRYLTIAAALACAAASSFAGTFSSIVVFGDSLSDNGNLFAVTGQPPAPYFQGRFSNGPVAVEQLAADLGVSPAALLDFAFAGATTGIGNTADGGSPSAFGAFNIPGMLTEFTQSQASLAPFAGGLFIVWGGPNDFISNPNPAAIGPAIANLLTIIGGIEGLGATHILVPGMPDLGLTPRFRAQGAPVAAGASALTDAFNAALQASLPAGVTYFDTAALLRAVVSNPGAFGFTNVTDPCLNLATSTVCNNPNQFLFWDDLHPTTATDAIVAGDFAAAAVPEPATMLLAAAGCGLLLLWRRRVTVG